MNWSIKRGLNDAGRTRAMAVPVELGKVRRYSKVAETFEAYNIRTRLQERLLPVLGGIALLSENKRLSTAYGIAAVTMLSSKEAEAYMQAYTEVGLVVPKAELIRPYDETVYVEPGREVYVQPQQIDRVAYIYSMTEEGESVLRIKQAIAEQNKQI